MSLLISFLSGLYKEHKWQTLYHYKGGLFNWVQDYEDAFTEFVILGQTTWNDDDTTKRRLVPNAQNIGMVDIFRNRQFSKVPNNKI
jgi:hypothetical protein